MIKNSISSCGLRLLLFFIPVLIFSQQNSESARRDIIQYGTETEIEGLITSLKAENTDSLDEDLITLAQDSRNHKVLIGIFSFFGDRQKKGLEERALKVISERENETNETVHAAMDYLGKIKCPEAVPVIMELLDTEERRFLSTGFRAISLASSSDKSLADETAEFLIDYYEFREPGSDNRSVLINAIGATGSTVGVELLSNIAVNTDERIPLRMAALDALSKIGNDKGLEAILACVGTNDPNVRSSAIGALGPFTGSEVDKAILDGFRDSYYRSRIASAQAARDRKLESAVPFLKFRAERDDVPNVKDEAIRALGAIANAEALEVLESLFLERKNSERVRVLSADLLMQHTADKNFTRLLIELDEAKSKNQTSIYNGFLRVVGAAVLNENKTEVENLARRFMRNGTVIEKLYGLDMALNNRLASLDAEIITLAKDRNESIARKAGRIAETLGITIPE